MAITVEGGIYKHQEPIVPFKTTDFSSFLRWNGGLMLKKPSENTPASTDKSLHSLDSPNVIIIEENLRALLGKHAGQLDSNLPEGLVWPLPIDILVNSDARIDEIRAAFPQNLSTEPDTIVGEFLVYIELERRIANRLESQDSKLRNLTRPFPNVFGLGMIADQSGVNYLPCIVMEELAGYVNLDRYITNLYTEKKGNSDELHSSLTQLFTSMQRAFEFCEVVGLSHRDIKPQNLMVSPGGEVKIVDLGSATFTDKMSIAGFPTTYPYAPPEYFINYISAIKSIKRDGTVLEFSTDQSHDRFSLALSIMSSLCQLLTTHKRGEMRNAAGDPDYSRIIQDEYYMPERWERVNSCFSREAIASMIVNSRLNDAMAKWLVYVLSISAHFDPSKRAFSPAQICEIVAFIFRHGNTEDIDYVLDDGAIENLVW
jgi:hypothetical protein